MWFSVELCEILIEIRRVVVVVVVVVVVAVVHPAHRVRSHCIEGLNSRVLNVLT